MILSLMLAKIECFLQIILILSVFELKVAFILKNT